MQKFSDYRFCFVHIVAKFGSPEDLKKTIDVVGFQNINEGDVNGYTPLHHASVSGKLDNVKVLIGYGAKINAKSSDETRNWLPIHYATKYGFLNIVEEFIHAGLDKNVKTSFGLTPLHIACEYGHYQIAKYLISIDCSLNIESIPENHNLTPLNYAVMKNSLEIVELLINSGVDKYKANAHGDDALIMAVKRNYQEIAEYLICFGMVERIEEAYEISHKKFFSDLSDLIKYYIIIRDNLFNKSEILKIANKFIEEIDKININNVDKFVFDVFSPYKISGYFLSNITKQVGWLNKQNIKLSQYLEKAGLDVLAKKLKELDKIVKHKELTNKK